jgi:flagellar FliL protein
MADEPEIDDGESEAGGKSKALLFAVIGLIVIAIGVGAWVVLGSSASEDLTGADPALEAQAAQTGQTEVYELGDFHVNLSGSGGSRILMMEIAVEGIPDAITNIEARQHQVRDAILMLASDYEARELEGLDGKLRLRDEIHRRINAVLAPHKVDRVYYTEFKFGS